MLRIDIPTLSEFKALAQTRADACVSLYVPTSPLPQHSQANRTAFKDLARDALAQLKEAGLDKRRLEALAQPIEHLSGSDEPRQVGDKIRKRQNAKPSEVDQFWRLQANSLAVLITADMVQSFRLSETVKPLAEVADRFHMTPLVRSMTSLSHMLVLALSEERVKLLHVFVNMPPSEIRVPGFPKNAEETARRASVNERSPRRRLQGSEGQKVLLAKYARKVDAALHAVLNGLTMPMAFAATEPLASIFRSLNTCPGLIEESLEGNPDHITDAQLEVAALPILDRLYSREIDALKAQYDALKPGRATTDLSHTAHAATIGAVEQLVVDFNAVVPGLVDDTDGSVTYSATDDAETYSVVDEVARRALLSDARGEERDSGKRTMGVGQILST
jgi:hypothetical protein